MYHFIITVITCLILVGRLFGQWEILNAGIKGSLNDIDFVNEEIGWIACDESSLLKTEDGGQNWRFLSQVGSWNIHIIDFINDSIGWGAAADWTTDKSMILKTTDGGDSWQIQKEIPDRTNNWLNSVFVVDDSTVYVVVTNTNILKTSDGGVSWEDISPVSENRYFNSVCFVNSDTGFVAGSCSDGSGNSYALILKTEDGGKTWSVKISSDLGPICDLQFINYWTGFFLCDDGMLYKTEDAFNSWPKMALFESTEIYAYHANDASTIYAVTRSSYWNVDNSILKSTDGGYSFDMKFNINWDVNNIYFVNENIGFYFGGAPYGSTIFRTLDGGDHWKTELLSYPFHDICFIDRYHGIACGGLRMAHFHNGNIFITDDGGKSWEATLSEGEVLKCQLINNQVGFAFGFWGSLRPFPSNYKTVNGGISWMHAGPIYWCDWHFINEKIGWAVADSSVLKTVDGGDSWDLKWQSSGSLNSIQFIDSTTGWAVGENGLIVKYTEGNQWKDMAKITNLPLNDVFFIDKNNGFIAGGYLNGDEELQTILLKTTSGGETWEKIPDLQMLIHDIYYHDTQQGWIVGTNTSWQGVILETQDGGDHWTVQEDSLIGPLNALSYRDGYLWAAGDCGLVLRTTVDKTIGIKERLAVDDRQTCELKQNYPNPFNPGTTIEYALPKPAFVTLKVYDLLGKEIVILVEEHQTAGIHKFNWDATGLASGVYLYRLETEQFVHTKKLILMR